MIIEMSGGVHIAENVNMLWRGSQMLNIQILFIACAGIHFASSVVKSSIGQLIVICLSSGN